jgi:hypothetical protein
MRKASGDLKGALAAIDRALALAPVDFSALLCRAVILEGLGDPNAGEEFDNALAQLPPDEAVPQPMVPAVEHARKTSRRSPPDFGREVACEPTRAPRGERTGPRRAFHRESLAPDPALPSAAVGLSLSRTSGSGIPRSQVISRPCSVRAGDGRHPLRIRCPHRGRSRGDGALYPISGAGADAAMEGAQPQSEMDSDSLAP